MRTCKTPHRAIGEKRKRRSQSTPSAGLEIGKASEPDRQLDDLQKMLLGAAALHYAKADSAFREALREAILATVTDPQDKALFPEFFPSSYRSIH